MVGLGSDATRVTAAALSATFGSAFAFGVGLGMGAGMGLGIAFADAGGATVGTGCEATVGAGAEEFGFGFGRGSATAHAAAQTKSTIRCSVICDKNASSSRSFKPSVSCGAELVVAFSSASLRVFSFSEAVMAASASAHSSAVCWTTKFIESANHRSVRFALDVGAEDSQRS
jgi:hypothetical protein